MRAPYFYPTLSKLDPEKVFNNLMHLFNEESLKECFRELDPSKAVGIDGVTWLEYNMNLEENIKNLIYRMKRMAYIPLPVRQVMIEKEGKPGAERPLGISIVEDKIVQKMTQKVLESIYEPLFLKCSYGFRPKLGCHDAIKALHQYLFRNIVGIILDLDLANFFGTINHKKLEKILRQKIKDERFIRYLIRMFKAGVLSDGELTFSDEGVPQGSICSPVLANIFAHYVIDEWMNITGKELCQGKIEIFRYADDAVICCQLKQDASNILEALSQRLKCYDLQLNIDKTKMVPFSKKRMREGKKQSSFDFLGFTFYLAKSREGYIIPKIKTNRNRFKGKLRKVREWIRKARNSIKMPKIWRKLCRKVQGHIQYYGVSFNFRYVANFIYKCIREFFKWMNRRSQRRSMTWTKFKLFMTQNPPPKVKIYHSLF